MHAFNLKSFRQLKWQSLHTLSSRTHPQTPDSQLLLTQPRKTVNQEETALLSIAAKKSLKLTMFCMSLLSPVVILVAAVVQAVSPVWPLASDLWLLTLTRHFSAHNCSSLDIFCFWELFCQPKRSCCRSAAGCETPAQPNWPHSRSPPLATFKVTPVPFFPPSWCS